MLVQLAFATFPADDLVTIPQLCLIADSSEIRLDPNIIRIAGLQLGGTNDGMVHCVLQEVWRQAGEAKHLSQLLEVCLHASYITTAIPSHTHEVLSWRTTNCLHMSKGTVQSCHVHAVVQLVDIWCRIVEKPKQPSE